MQKSVIAGLLMMTTMPVWAEFTANYGLTNKHSLRGVQQTGQDVVVNGGADYSGPLGFYTGVWAYTGNFENNNYFGYDSYAGVGFNLGPLAVGAGYIRYEFDNNDDDFSEYTANMTLGDYRLSGNWDEDETYRYFELGANYQLWDKSGLVLTVGRTDDFNHNETWNYSLGFIKAMPSDVDIEVKLTRHDNKGNGLILGISKQIGF